MARLRNSVSGAVVEVADEKVSRLGSEWEPFESAEAEDKLARKPRSKTGNKE